MEVKSTRKTGGAVDIHGAREQVRLRLPGRQRDRTCDGPVKFTEVYLGRVGVEDFRRNPRGELSTRTATLHREGKLRDSWVCT